jgi:hypothetical protein
VRSGEVVVVVVGEMGRGVLYFITRVDAGVVGSIGVGCACC